MSERVCSSAFSSQNWHSSYVNMNGVYAPLPPHSHVHILKEVARRERPGHRRFYTLLPIEIFWLCFLSLKYLDICGNLQLVL